MTRTPRAALAAAAGLSLFVGITPSALAVVQSRTDAERNTLPPDYSEGGDFEGIDRLPNAGWDWTVSAGTNFSATAVAPNWVLGAAHTGTGLGATVTTQTGETYTIVDLVDDPNSDLRLFRVDGTFDSYAPLYNSSQLGFEIGRDAVLYGRGFGKGDEVWVNGEFKGWKAGDVSGPQSWGENVVDSFVNGGPGLGLLLQMDFDAADAPASANGTRNEGGLLPRDSGAGVFINVDGTYYLAGVHVAIEGPFKTSIDGEPFFGALTDVGGLYRASDNFFFQDTAEDIPYGFFSTRVSSNLPWIASTIATQTPSVSVIPEPTSVAGLAGLSLLLRRRR